MLQTIKQFIHNHPVYLLGYGITTVTYFSKYSHEVKEAYDFAGIAVLAIYSCFVGLVSWLYVAARVINSFCN